MTLLVSASFSQTVSLTNLLKGSSSTAATADQSTDPVVDTTADDFAPPDTFVPCGKQESCGEAKNFKSEKEFQDFLDKYTQKQEIQVDYLVRPQPMAQAMMIRGA